MRVLLVEDDKALSDSLAKALRREGFTLSLAFTGAEAIINAEFDKIDIVILDLGLPDMDGLTVLEKLRLLQNPAPVLILTARDKLEDKILGLEKGADDYLAKPFELDELVARLKVFERRLASKQHQLLLANQIKLDSFNHYASYQDIELDLSRKEYLLLKALVESAGRVLTKENLEAKLYDIDNEVASNALEVHIHNLRKKTDKTLIKTIRGIGYTIKNN